MEFRTYQDCYLPSILYPLVRFSNSRSIVWSATYRRIVALRGGEATLAEILHDLEKCLPMSYTQGNLSYPGDPKSLRKELTQTKGLKPVSRGSHVFQLSIKKDDGFWFV